MKAATAVLLLALLCTSGAVATNPVTKVVELLGDLEKKVLAEGEVEVKAFDDFVDWCDDTAANLGFEIKALKKKKAKDEACIEKAVACIQNAETVVDNNAGEIAKTQKELD